MPSRSRRYSNVAERVDPDQLYSPEGAVDLLKDISTAKFDETVEFHLRTNVDPRHADQMVRGVVGLPHGIGKTVRVWCSPEPRAVKSPASRSRLRGRGRLD